MTNRKDEVLQLLTLRLEKVSLLRVHRALKSITTPSKRVLTQYLDKVKKEVEDLNATIKRTEIDLGIRDRNIEFELGIFDGDSAFTNDELKRATGVVLHNGDEMIFVLNISEPDEIGYMLGKSASNTSDGSISIHENVVFHRDEIRFLLRLSCSDLDVPVKPVL